MENVTDKLDDEVVTVSIPSKDIMCSSSSSEQVVAAPASPTSAEKLNLSSDMVPIIEVVTEQECSTTQEYQEHDDSINTAKEEQTEFEVQGMDKTVENLLSDEREGETVIVMPKEVICPTESETDVSLTALAQDDNDADPMQQNHISYEIINADKSGLIETIESEEPKPFECTDIILVTDSDTAGEECQVVETEEVETKILTESSLCENSSQTDSIALKSEGCEELSSSQWSEHVTNEGEESAVPLKGEEGNSEHIEKAVTKAKTNPEERFIAVLKDNENTELVSVQDLDVQSDDGLSAETLIAISILQNNDCQESESKGEETQVILEEVVEDEPKFVENSKQTGIEIGCQANDYEIERRSGKVPARRRVIPFKFRDYRNPDLVEQGNDSDSDYCPSENEVRSPKRRKVAPPVGPSGRRPGRPRKVRPEIEQKQTGSTVDTATSTNTELEESVHQLPQRDSIAQVMTSSQTTSTSAKRTEKSSTSNSSGKNHFTCKICQRTFKQKANMKVHLRVHSGEKPFLCTIEGCTKRFRNNESLRRHNLTHLGIKPFGCELCENKFSSKVSLQEHMAIHNNCKPHVCHLCQAPFRQISCLRRHLITHSSDKPFECNNCGQKFSQMVYLKSHSKVHTGEKPFVCDHCKRGFAHQSDLIRHKIIHTGKKPFACHICNAKFSDPSSKRRHVKEHMGTKPYSCHLCKDSFKRAGQLKVHLTSKHSIDSEIQTVNQTQSGQTLQFAFKDSDKLTSIAIDDKSSAYHKKIAQIVEGLTGSEVTHIATPVNVDDIILQETDSVTIEGPGGESQTVAQVVASAMQSAGMTSITACNEGQLSALCQATDIQEGESGYPDQITATIMEEDLPSLIESTQDGATVITIVSLDDVTHGQELSCTEEHTEYAQQIIGNVEGDDEQPQYVEVHYEQNEETIKEDDVETETESQTMVECEKSEYTADFVSKPDFSSQEYYDWLSNFTEVCKSLPMPLNPDLFHKISQVHKTLSDVMATPSGVLADKENFRILMNISRDLHFIISEHLTFVLQNLDGERNADDH